MFVVRRRWCRAGRRMRRLRLVGGVRIRLVVRRGAWGARGGVGRRRGVCVRERGIGLCGGELGGAF